MNVISEKRRMQYIRYLH